MSGKLEFMDKFYNETEPDTTGRVMGHGPCQAIQEETKRFNTWAPHEILFLKKPYFSISFLFVSLIT